MIRLEPSSLMVNYSRIKNVAPSRRCRIVEVEERTGKLRREVARRLDEENVRENKTPQDRRLSTVRRDTQAPTIVRGGLAGVGSGCLGAVSRCLGGAPYHHYGLARIGNSEVFFVSLSLLFLCFVIIIKYSRAQKGTKASYPPSSSLSVALELNGYC